MNERGFFTIIGLCLLLVTAISIRGIQEFEGNYSRSMANLQAEQELQLFAESAIIEAVENELPDIHTVTFHSDRLGTVSVKVSSKSATISTTKDASDNLPEKVNKKVNGKVFMSVASCDNPNTGKKMYRRALAYILDNKTIRFMSVNEWVKPT